MSPLCGGVKSTHEDGGKRVFIYGEGDDSGPACSRDSTGIAVGSNCCGDPGAEPILIPPGAELRGEHRAFVQESVGLVASGPESVDGVGLLTELSGLAAVAINPGEVSTESSCGGGHKTSSIAVGFSDEQARSLALRAAARTLSLQSARAVSMAFCGWLKRRGARDFAHDESRCFTIS